MLLNPAEMNILRLDLKLYQLEFPMKFLELRIWFRWPSWVGPNKFCHYVLHKTI